MLAIYFPFMHSELILNELPQWVKLFDPGLAELSAAKGYWRPDALALDQEEAQKYVQESLQFGQQFKNINDLVYLSAGEIDDFYSHTSLALQTQLRRSLKSSSEEQEKAQLIHNSLRAQMVILLAWSWEKKVLEYWELDKSVQDSWQKFRSDLGIEEEQDLSLSKQFDQINSISESLDWPWGKILPWFLFYLSPEVYLFIEDPLIKQEWEQNGVVFERAGFKSMELSNNNEDLWQTKDYGWKLSLHKGAVADKPWLNKLYHVLYMVSRGVN